MSNLNFELIIDNFAGGGGASTGIEAALGGPVDIAINHDPAAIAMHKVNHPYTYHYCESVWDVDPREATQGHPVALAWFSPDCKHFSKAKGGRPVEKKIRGLAWVSVRWAATVRPRVIILENVEEFQTWGPLAGDRPDPAQRGRTFRSFVNALHRHGYKVDWRELRACDYGAPTVRKRFFLIARCDGRSIQWPEPTHGDPKSPAVQSGRLKPWRTAAEIIDWSLPCPSIFERRRPLAEATLRRISRGIMRFVVEAQEPFIIKYHGEKSSREFRGQSLEEPLMTLDTSNRFGLVAAMLTKFQQNSTGQRTDEPLHTVVVAGAPRFGIVTSHLIKFKGTNVGQPVTDPLQTITAGGLHFGEVRAFLIKYYGKSVGQLPSEPVHTVTSRDTFGLVTVHGEQYWIADIGLRMLQPHELFAAQGFPADYIIDRDIDGRPQTKASQVARCGNAVPPPLAEALTAANLPELCMREVS